MRIVLLCVLIVASSTRALELVKGGTINPDGIDVAVFTGKSCDQPYIMGTTRVFDKGRICFRARATRPGDLIRLEHVSVAVDGNTSTTGTVYNVSAEVEWETMQDEYKAYEYGMPHDPAFRATHHPYLHGKDPYLNRSFHHKVIGEGGIKGARELEWSFEVSIADGQLWVPVATFHIEQNLTEGTSLDRHLLQYYEGPNYHTQHVQTSCSAHTSPCQYHCSSGGHPTGCGCTTSCYPNKHAYSCSGGHYHSDDDWWIWVGFVFFVFVFIALMWCLVAAADPMACGYYDHCQKRK